MGWANAEEYISFAKPQLKFGQRTHPIHEEAGFSGNFQSLTGLKITVGVADVNAA